jgi:hypothetical protein
VDTIYRIIVIYIKQKDGSLDGSADHPYAAFIVFLGCSASNQQNIEAAKGLMIEN